MEKQSVEITNMPPVLGDAEPAANFVFGVLCFVFWGSCTGHFGDGAAIAIAICQLGVFVCYNISGTAILKSGNTAGGSLFLIFGAMYGGIGGGTNLATYICGVKGIPFDGKVASIVWVCCGILLFAVLPAFRKTPGQTLILFTTGAIGNLLLGLTGLGICGSATGMATVVAGWSFFICGAMAFYNVFLALNEACGTKLLPNWPPFFK